ncbi:hypothetical protein SDC9_69008 [bioreactor metagenome]|uniref:Uncharacterized protein n=1 Tax=bioreactor metagenome TaxID=1076179 RepID=A0A644Y3Q9_9ZZZZ
MAEKKNDTKQDVLKVQIAGKPVTLRFTSEPNTAAADFIKRTLVSAYLLKAV